jgi:hypothetical protein
MYNSGQLEANPSPPYQHSLWEETGDRSYLWQGGRGNKSLSE